MARTNCTREDDNVVHIVLDHATRSVRFLQCYLTETTVSGQTCRSTRTHYPNFEPTGLCSFSLMLRVKQRNNQYQFYSPWFDPTGDRTNYLQHVNHYTADAVLSLAYDVFSLENAMKKMNYFLQSGNLI